MLRVSESAVYPNCYSDHHEKIDGFRIPRRVSKIQEISGLWGKIAAIIGLRMMAMNVGAAAPHKPSIGGPIKAYQQSKKELVWRFDSNYNDVFLESIGSTPVGFLCVFIKLSGRVC